MQRIVAYVGDGNNDGKALRKADIGFSFGKQGTEIARYNMNC
jgi:P-type E1-E2 ATPase